MREIIGAADRLLRGKLATREDLASGRIGVSAGVLVAVGLCGGAIYGAAMGLFGVLRPTHATWMQMTADAAKVPLLFLLTLLVAFPSLYAFSALANSKLGFVETLKLLLLAVALNLVLLASFAPVTAFFTVSTTSYAFMVLLNVGFFVLSGAIGLGVLGKALRTVYAPSERRAEPLLLADATEAEIARARKLAQEREQVSAAERANAVPRRIFMAWLAIYALVGCQMAWVMRPFIGSPGLEFQLVRPRGGSFFEAVLTALGHVLMGR